MQAHLCHGSRPLLGKQRQIDTPPCRILVRSSKESPGAGAARDLGGDASPVRKKDLGVGLKGAWFGAEVLGDLLSSAQGSKPAAAEAFTQVVARLLKPAAKVPTSPWETFLLCLSDGDVQGCWGVVSGKAALFSAPVVAAALLTHLVTGHALPGVLGGGWTELLASGLLVAGLATEVLKFSGGLQGGETGTGGRF